MKIKLYIDVLFAVNAWADLGLLILTAWIMGVTAARHRLLLAACFGGIWSSVIPFLELSGVWRVLLTVGIAGLAAVQDRLWTKEQTIPCKSRDKSVSVIDLFRRSFHAGTVSHRDRIYGRTIFS